MAYATPKTRNAGDKVTPRDVWAVLPFHADVRSGASPEPLFTTTQAHGSAFFDAQNAMILLARATGRRFYTDVIRTYEAA